MLKESENPPIIWCPDFSVYSRAELVRSDEESISNFTGRWRVAHTKSRNEKALAQDLISRNVSYFLPMNWRVNRRKGRTLRSLLPLFGGYLFFCGAENERLETLRTNRVANIIEVQDQERLLEQLLKIEKALGAGAPLIPHNYLKAGQHCKVLAGPLMGLEGIVQKTKGVTRLILQVDMLGQATSVEIDSDMIESID